MADDSKLYIDWELKGRLEEQIKNATKDADALVDAIEKVIKAGGKAPDKDDVVKNIEKNAKAATEVLFKLAEVREKAVSAIGRNTSHRNEELWGFDDSRLQRGVARIDEIIAKVMNIGAEAAVSANAIKNLLASLDADLVMKDVKGGTKTLVEQLNKEEKERAKAEKDAAKEAKQAAKEEEDAAARNAKAQEQIKDAMAKIATARANLSAASKDASEQEKMHAQLLMSLLDQLSQKLAKLKGQFLGEKGALEGVLGSGLQGLLRNVNTTIGNIGKSVTADQSEVSMISPKALDAAAEKMEDLARKIVKTKAEIEDTKQKLSDLEAEEQRGVFSPKDKSLLENRLFKQKAELANYEAEMKAASGIVMQLAEQMRFTNAEAQHLTTSFGSAGTAAQSHAARQRELSETFGAYFEEMERKEREEAEAKKKAAIELDEYNKKLASTQKLLDSLEKVRLDDQSRREIARIKGERAEYDALGKKLAAIAELERKVAENRNLIKGGAKINPYTKDEITKELDAIQRRYNEDLARGRATEEAAAKSRDRLTESTRRASQAIRNMSQSNQHLIGTFKDIETAGRNTNKMMDQMATSFGTFFSFYGLRNILKNIITIGGQFEFQHVALQNILGDIQDANILFTQLQDLAVESPKTFMELTAYAKQLSAYQVPVSELYDTTKRLADMSTGLGVDMNRLILAYGQVRSAAVLRGQELRQFTEAGIPMVQALADKFTQLNGKLTTTADVFKLISARKVPFEMVKEVLWDMTNQGGQFFNMQGELADTLYGKWQKLQDTWQIMLGHLADGNSIMGGFMRAAVEGVVALTRSLDILAPALGLLGLSRVARNVTQTISSNYQKLSAKTDNGAVATLRVAKEREIADLLKRQLIYKEQLNAADRAKLATANRIMSIEYQRLAAEGKISERKAYQLMQEGKLTRYHFKRLMLMKGYTQEQVAQIVNGNTQILKGGATIGGTLWNGAKNLMGGPMGMALTGVGIIASIYSAISEKNEALDQKGESMMKHAQENANNLQKSLNNIEADGSLKKKIESLEEALLQTGSTGEAIVAKSREHMDDINERWKTLKEGAESYKTVLDSMGNEAGKALFKEAIDDSDIESRIKEYDNAVNEVFKQYKDIERHSETYKNIISQLTASDSKLAKQLEGKTLFEQIDLIGADNLIEKINKMRESLRGTYEYGNSALAQSIYPLEHHSALVSEVSSKWDNVSKKSIPAMEDELRAAAENLKITDFNNLSAEQKRSLEILTREYVNSIAEGSKEAKNKLAEELADQVFHIKIVGDFTIDTTKMSGFASYVWEKFGGIVAGDEGKVKIGQESFTKQQVKSVFDNIGQFAKEYNSEWKSQTEEAAKLRKSGAEELAKELEDEANKTKSVLDALNLFDDGKKKGSKSGSQKDAELERLKNRIDLYKKFYSELENARKIYGAGAVDYLKENGFGEVFGWKLGDVTNYRQSMDELTRGFNANTEARKKFVNSVDAEKVTQQRKEDTEAIKMYVSELQKMMQVMAENYKTYRKWVELTGDTNLAARAAGVTQNTSYQEYLKEQMEKALATKSQGTVKAEVVLEYKEADIVEQFGKESEVFAVWDEWRKHQQMLKKEQWDLYEEAIKNAKDYDDKIEDVNRSLEKQIEALEALGAGNSLLDSARRNAADKVSELKWEKFKKESDWGRVFGDLDNMSLETIKKMVDAMKKFQKETRLSEKETRAWQKAMNDLTNKKAVLDPINELADSVKEYNKALAAKKEAEEQKRIAEMPYAERKRYLSQQGIDPNTALSVEEAKKRVDKSANDLSEAFNRLKKAANAIANSFKDLGGSFSSLGSAIGGDIGNILSGFGSMFSQLGNGISAIQNLDMNAKGFTGVFNKISAVMTVVSAMIEMNKALASILPSTESIYEKHAAEQRKINRLREAVDAYRVAVAKARAEEENWIGHDPLRELQDAYKIHGEIVNEYYSKLYEAQEAYVEASAGIKKAIIPIVAAITAIAAVVAGAFTFGAGGVGVGALGAAAIGALSAGTVAVTGATAAAIGAAIAAGIGAAVGQAIQAGIDAITYKEGQTDARSNMKVQTRHKTMFRSEKTQNLEEWVKENLGLQLFDDLGMIDLKVAQAVLDSGVTLVGETQETLEKLMELRKEYDEWEQSVKDYISNSFGGLADDLTNAVWDWLSGGKDALDSFKDYASDTFKSIAQDAVKSFLKAAVIDQFEEQLEDLYKFYSMTNPKTGERTISEMELMLGVASIAGDMATAFETVLPVAQALGETLANAFEYQGYDIVNGSGGESSSTGSSIKSISESTADLLSSYLNAVRADVSVNRSMIAQYYPQFLSAMSQGNVIADAQLVQLRSIVANTSRNVEFVENIYKILHGVAPDSTSIKVK